MAYVLFNKTDGVYADGREYHSKKEVAEAKKQFLKRFEHQGYYLTANWERIPPEDVELVVEER